MLKADQLIQEIKSLKDHMGERDAKRFELDVMERAVVRMNELDAKCGECKVLLTGLDKLVRTLAQKNGALDPADRKELQRKVRDIKNHLLQKHKIVIKGYYTAIFMSIGVSLGIILGLIAFDNIALGLPIGISIGLAVGAGLDADAKKKGNII